MYCISWPFRKMMYQQRKNGCLSVYRCGWRSYSSLVQWSNRWSRNIRRKYKNNDFIAKLAYVYEGIEKKTPQSKRYRIVNPHYFCGTSACETNEAFWDDVYEYIENHYDVSRIKKIFLMKMVEYWLRAASRE